MKIFWLCLFPLAWVVLGFLDALVMVHPPIRVLPFVGSVWSTATANSRGQHLFLREKVAESHANVALTSTAPSFLWELLEGCTLVILHWQGLQLLRAFPALQPSRAGQGGGGDFPFPSLWQCKSAGESRIPEPCHRAAPLSLMAPESAGLCCQEVLTCTVYLCFPGGRTAT